MHFERCELAGWRAPAQNVADMDARQLARARIGAIRNLRFGEDTAQTPGVDRLHEKTHPSCGAAWLQMQHTPHRDAKASWRCAASGVGRGDTTQRVGTISQLNRSLRLRTTKERPTTTTYETEEGAARCVTRVT